MNKSNQLAYKDLRMAAKQGPRTIYSLLEVEKSSKRETDDVISYVSQPKKEKKNLMMQNKDLQKLSSLLSNLHMTQLRIKFRDNERSNSVQEFGKDSLNQHQELEEQLIKMENQLKREEKEQQEKKQMDQFFKDFGFKTIKKMIESQDIEEKKEFKELFEQKREKKVNSFKNKKSIHPEDSIQILKKKKSMGKKRKVQSIGDNINSSFSTVFAQIPEIKSIKKVCSNESCLKRETQLKNQLNSLRNLHETAVNGLKDIIQYCQKISGREKID